jgi:hypothetical protein
MREALALSRNFRQAALLRRRLRSKYGRVIPGKPSILIGEALATMEHAPWTRLAILVGLFIVASRTR